ncbi:MAG: ABC transporter permease [Chloroflexota bacterium]
MKAFFHLYIANVKEFFRDRMAVFWTLAFPITFIFLFGTIFSGIEGNLSFDIGVVNKDNNQAGKELIEVFKSLEFFEVTQGEKSDLIAALKESDFDIVMLIPIGFTAALDSGNPIEIEIIYDPSDQTTSQIALSIVREVLSSFDRQFTDSPQLVNFKMTSITADTLSQIDFIIPGILAMSLMQLGLFGTAPQLVALREQQVLRRIGPTPLPKTTLLAAQVFHRIVLGFTQLFLIIFFGVTVFDITVAGNYSELVGVVLLSSLMFVSLGYLIAGMAKTQESVNGITSFLNFPMMFLSGLFFPIEIMPEWIRPVVNAIPISYVADAFRHIMLDAPSHFGLAKDIYVILAWFVVSSILAVRLFKWDNQD